MKHLNQFITEYIVKKKLDKPIDSEYLYHPEDKRELIRNISELFKKGETNLNCIDTSNVTDMSNLFYYEKSKNINFDISDWDVSKVKYMQYMFHGLKNFNCDLSKWDVSNVINMVGVFEGCKKFTGKGLDNWNVSNVKYIKFMFSDCINFNCDLSNWDISNVEYMIFAFYNCTSLKNTPSWYKE